MGQIDEVVLEIEKKAQSMPNQEISSTEIGEMVMEALKKLDEVAFVRFASVYRKFADITSFKKLLENM